MDNHLVTERCKLIRAIARKALNGNWLNVTIGFLIYYLFASFIPQLITDFTGIEQVIDFYGQQIPVTISVFSDIYKMFLGGVFSFGLVSFLLTYLRWRNVEYPKLFDGFNYFGKLLGLSLLMGLKVFLWGLLFVIPGIIAAIRYSQSFYILFDHPDYKVTECINESKRLMSGNKGKFFLLVLSYIGWMILAALPTGIINSLMLNNYITITSEVLLTVISLILFIPELFVETYIFTGETVFYDLLTEKLVPNTNEEN